METRAAASQGPDDPLPDGRRVRERLWAATGFVALAAGAVAALPALDGVRERFAGAAPAWLVAVLVLEAGSCLAFVVVFRGVFCPRLAWRPSYHLAMAAQGTNVLLPAGGASGLALGAWVLSRMGVPARQLGIRSVAFFVLTSSVNFATAALVGGALALGVLSGPAPVALTAGPALLAAATILAVVVGAFLSSRSEAGARRLGPFAVILAALTDGVAEAGRLLRSGHPLILAGALGYMAFDVAALGAAFAAVGAVPAVGLLLLAYVVGQLGGLLPVPGGVGGADGALIAALVVYGVPLGEAAAAVLAYRAFQLGLPAVLGTLATTRLPGVLSARLDGGAALPLRPAPITVAARAGVPAS